MQIDISKSINPLLASLTPSELAQIPTTLSPDQDSEASNTSQGQVRLFWSDSWAVLCQRALLKSLSSPANVLGHQTVFSDSLTHEFYASVRPEILMFWNLSFLISGFFPNYFQINFQLIHKDEIWHVTYNPKHVVILLPISWFHGGLNKHHMWSTAFLCVPTAWQSRESLLCHAASSWTMAISRSSETFVFPWGCEGP